MTPNHLLPLLLCAAPALAAEPAWAAAPARADAVLQAVVADAGRPPADTVRDRFRHPYESLRFWGLKPGMTVVDVEPGAGWWAEILAPYAARTGGHYIAATFDLADPAIGDNFRRQRIAFQEHYSGGRYGQTRSVNLGRVSGLQLDDGSADMILVARAFHNWAMTEGQASRYLQEFHRVLKHGGVMAVEQHRAAPGADPRAGDGYVPESYVIEEARKAGFVLEARSEINANPKDSKDHPFGVWTLPPMRLSAREGSPPTPGFNHARFDAIGESDRMTLRFRKP